MYRNLFSSMELGVVYQDASGKILSMNPAAEKILGLSAEQANELSSESDVWQSIKEDGSPYPGVEHPAMVALATGKIVRNAVMGVIHQKSNERIWININAVPEFRSGKKKPFRVFTTFDDITAKKESEEKLKLMQFGVDNSMIAVFRIDENAIIRYVNKQACVSLGYTEEELLRMKIIDIDPNFNFDSWKEHRANVRQQGSRTFITAHKRKDGSIFPVEVTVNYHIFGDDKFSFSFAKDITERMEAEKKLKESKTQLSNAMRIAKLAHWEYDPRHHEFIFNDQFYTVFRTTGEKVGGYRLKPAKYAELFIHSKDYHIVQDEIGKAMNAREINYSGRIEHRIKYGDGNSGFASVQIFVNKDNDGRPLSIFGTVQDISEQKKIEEELIQAKEKAIENDKLKTAFLNNVSHEIRTPLNVIFGYSGLINEGISDPEMLRLMTAPIMRSAGQLQKIIEDVLDISRIEAGQLQIASEKTNISELIEQILSEQKLMAETKKLNLIKGELPGKENAITETDKSRLRQIITNLVTNAIKYTDDGYVKVSAKVTLSEILFSVEDSGSGIDPKYHSMIFERFHRLDKEQSGNYHSTTQGGTGLGLSISKGLAELLGGRMWLKSTPGEGTTFYFTIPKK